MNLVTRIMACCSCDWYFILVCFIPVMQISYSCYVVDDGYRLIKENEMQTQELCGNGFVCTNNDTHMIIDWTNQARNNNTVFHRIHVHIYVYNKTTDHWDAINQEDAMKTQVSFRYTWFRDDNFTFGVLRWTSPTTGSTCFSFINFGSDDSNIDITDKTTEAKIIQVSKTENQNKMTTPLSISKSQDKGSGWHVTMYMYISIGLGGVSIVLLMLTIVLAVKLKRRNSYIQQQERLGAVGAPQKNKYQSVAPPESDKKIENKICPKNRAYEFVDIVQGVPKVR